MLMFFVRHLRGRNRGFTLIELLIVIAIIAILAAVLIPNFLRSRAQAQVAASKSNMKNIATALESYAADWNGQYPNDLAALASGDSPYMRTVPKRPNGTDYTYRANNTSTPPTYTLCDDTTLDGVGRPNDILVYTPDQGLTEQQNQTCP